MPIDETQFEQVASHFQTIQLKKQELWEKEGRISASNTQALEPCELLIMPFSVFMQFYQSIPATKQTAELIGLQKLQAMASRNSSLLIDTPQYLIAQYLGIRPESLSRIRKRFGS